MDRDNNWGRIKKAYDTMCFSEPKTNISPIDYIKNSYENQIFDEFLEPVNFT
jgi:2,3-bisphosphoglycerate-independent phosphoglycerate mutase